MNGHYAPIDWSDPDWGGHVHEASYLDAEPSGGDR